MTQSDGWLQRDLSAVLRARSAAKLEDAFGRYVRYELTDHGWDPRDAMVEMTPFIDCARRLGLDPAQTLGAIAAGGPPWLKELFEVFVRRTDVTLGNFGWSLEETAEGLTYRHQPARVIRRR
jgi:hypothetical protein